MLFVTFISYWRDVSHSFSKILFWLAEILKQEQKELYPAQQFEFFFIFW
jgi:hypothetical protein